MNESYHEGNYIPDKKAPEEHEKLHQKALKDGRKLTTWPAPNEISESLPD